MRKTSQAPEGGLATAVQKAQKAIAADQLDKARKLLRQADRRFPGNPGILLLLASVHGRQQDFAAVLRLCDQILALHPHHPDALIFSANALSALGRHQAAAERYERASRQSPDNPILLHNHGHALQLAGDSEAAIEPLTRSIQLQPDHAEAHFALAMALSSCFRFTDALPHFEAALRLKPDLTDARLQYAGCLRELGRLPEAFAEYHRLVDQPSPPPGALGGLAMCHYCNGDSAAAIATYERLLERQPDSVIALGGLMEMLERTGDPDAAYALFQERILPSGQLDPTILSVLLRICHRYDCCAQAADTAQQLLRDMPTESADTQALHYALGKFHDRQGDHDTAFRHYHAANAMNNFNFEATAHHERITRLMEHFSPQRLADLPRSGIDSELPVFIVGMPRSGTSLTEQILASHPMAHGAGELDEINRLVSGLHTRLDAPRPYPDNLDQLDRQVLHGMAQDYLRPLRAMDGDAVRISDKMPQNFMHLGMIALLFPRARVIHCRRHPLDTCLSIYFQSFNRVHNYASRLTDLGHYYLEYLRLMAHWQSCLDIEILDLQYEELVGNPRETTRRLIDFAGLEWDEHCLRFHESDRLVITASYDQVRKPLYQDSKYRWKRYEKHLTPLIEVLGDQAFPQSA